VSLFSHLVWAAYPFPLPIPSVPGP
jgi:hypothetical protein